MVQTSFSLLPTADLPSINSSAVFPPAILVKKTHLFGLVFKDESCRF